MRRFSLLKLRSTMARWPHILSAEGEQSPDPGSGGKKAELSDEVILRLVELDGKPQSDVKISFPASITGAREVNGQEQPVGPATVADGALVTSFGGYQPRTFALRLAPASVSVARGQSTPVSLALYPRHCEQRRMVTRRLGSMARAMHCQQRCCPRKLVQRCPLPTGYGEDRNTQCCRSQRTNDQSSPGSLQPHLHSR